MIGLLVVFIAVLSAVWWLRRHALREVAPGVYLDAQGRRVILNERGEVVARSCFRWPQDGSQ